MLDDLAGLTALAVFAHPDDESLACGGTLACLADLGAGVVLLCASRGEAGTRIDAPLATSDELADVRCEELRAAARALGIRAVRILDHPDGWLRWAQPARLRQDILATITDVQPDLVITFDEDGLYWHADHIGVHEYTSSTIAMLGADAPPLYYVSMANDVMTHVVDNAAARKWASPGSGFWNIEPGAFGTPPRPSAFLVDVCPWVPRKLEALQCHRTQMGARNPFTLISDADARAWLGVERFRRAHGPDSTPHVLEALAARQEAMAHIILSSK